LLLPFYRLCSPLLRSSAGVCAGFRGVRSCSLSLLSHAARGAKLGKGGLVDLHPDIGYAIWSDAHVLISGGNARTRTSVARMIHERSPRGRGSFAVVHADARLYDLMTALERLVAKPSGGTVFLQEAGALDSTIQDQLLRLIEAATRG